MTFSRNYIPELLTFSKLNQHLVPLPECDFDDLCHGVESPVDKKRQNEDN